MNHPTAPPREIRPTNAGQMENAWHDGSGAGKALDANWVGGSEIECKGETNWIADCNLSARGSVTRVDIRVRISIDGGATYRQVQTISIASGVITLSGAEWRKTVAAAAAWAFDFNTKGATHVKVDARAGAGAAAGSAFLIRLRGAGV